MMSRRRLIYVVAGALLVGSLGLAAYRMWPAAKDAPAEAAQVPKIADADLPAAAGTRAELRPAAGTRVAIQRSRCRGRGIGVP